MQKIYKVIITDTSCFILLQKINALELLHDLFNEVITTTEIATEVGQPLPSWVTVKNVGNASLKQEYRYYVDLGEASAIALAAETIYDFIILDDARARKFAETLGMRVKGTIGLLLIAKNAGLIPILKPYIERIQQTNFRISTTILDRVLRDAGE